jgi:hypothetical protein
VLVWLPDYSLESHSYTFVATMHTVGPHSADVLWYASRYAVLGSGVCGGLGVCGGFGSPQRGTRCAV